MNIRFEDLSIKSETKKAIATLGFEYSTDIQSKSIPVLLEKKDVIGQAQTGTGKTFAYGIPMIEQIDVEDGHIQGLIICPTRELTLQVYKELLKLALHQPALRIAVIYGGESYTKQFKQLSLKPHIVVATPGRTIDHMKRNTIHFNHLRMLVLDEADEMLKMGFQEDLETILKDTPKERQTALFSATMPAFIKKAANQYLKEPVMIKIESKTLTVDKIKQVYYEVKKQDRDQLMIRLFDFYHPNSAIVFANTKQDVDNLTAFLQKNNYLAEALHGDLKQNQRDYVMQKFRQKRITYLVATDVAARGLDIPHVDFVFNYELPFEDEVYVHRIGRTGRAGKTGVSVSLVYPSMKNRLLQIERLIKSTMAQENIPTPEEISFKNQDAFKQTLVQYIEQNDKSYEDLLKHLHDHNYDPYDVINALLAKLAPNQKDYPAIEIPKRSQQRTSSSVSSDRSKKDFTWLEINLGSNDGFRPVTLVDYIKKHADVFPKNIGDIDMQKEKTFMEVNKLAVKRLSNLQQKFYKGKKIKIFSVKNR